ncbi:ATP-binding protein [Novosphingobium sp. AP12]|uniref:ATP-binding protein n=1 Tax=Novosphingobium sp. AP12 TaxID=1144305 RepID=UPI001EE6518E|nr:ATP-binding protein [Novosphingobium sp. AP12]
MTNVHSPNIHSTSVLSARPKPWRSYIMSKSSPDGPGGAHERAPELADLLPILQRIAVALERLAPAKAEPSDLHAHPGYYWAGLEGRLIPVPAIDHVPLSALVGIEPQKAEMLANLRGFGAGATANHMLLWGARGTGKSSLTKAAHAAIHAETQGRIALVEVPRSDIETLPGLLERISGVDRRFLLFFDDLSFDDGDGGYKSMKAVLDGGIRGCPANVLLAVTSNRRHLLRREMIENERSSALHASEAVEEKVSLADRFGLSLGFHNAAQDDYLAMVIGHLGLLADAFEADELVREAENWARRRGSRSGRVAVQFARHVAARQMAAA